MVLQSDGSALCELTEEVGETPVSDAERDLKQELRLRPERPPVTRLSRTVLMSLATLAALTVSGALIWALFQNGAHSKAAEELHTTDSKQPPDELAAAS